MRYKILTAIMLFAIYGCTSTQLQTNTVEKPKTAENPQNSIHKEKDSAEPAPANKIAQLAEKLTNENWQIRSDAVEELGKTGDPAAVQPLAAALKDKDEYIREIAVKALGRIKHPEAALALVEILKNEATLPAREIIKEESLWRTAIDALKSIGKPAVKPLTVILEELQNDNVLQWVLYVLGKIGDTEAVSPLIRMLENSSESPRTRKYAARALGDIGDPRAAEPLIEALKTENGDIRAWSARALGMLGDKKAAGPLLKLLDDDGPLVRAYAALALGMLNHEEAATNLKKLWKEDEERRVKLGAAFGLFKITGDEDALKLLLSTAKNGEKADRYHAIYLLGMTGDTRAVESLIGLLENAREDDVIRGASARALQELGDERAVAPLIEALKIDSKPIRRTVREALVGITQENIEESYVKWKEWHEENQGRQ